MGPNKQVSWTNKFEWVKLTSQRNKVSMDGSERTSQYKEAGMNGFEINQLAERSKH